MSHSTLSNEKHLLIFAWEYNGYHSVRGTALSKRPRQIAESFVKQGWQVTVIHKDHRGESGDKPYFSTIESSGVHRISIKSTKDTEALPSNPLVRKLETMFYVSMRGDRTYKWSDDVKKNFADLPLRGKPTYIIAMFSPRVPLYLGNYFSAKLGIPWIADLQDPIYEGVSRKTWPALNRWLRTILKSAHAIVHVSPKWAGADAERFGMPVATIRHAIVDSIPLPTVEKSRSKREFTVFYGGSISADIQSLGVVRQVIQNAAKKGVSVKIVLAGNENARTHFSSSLGEENIEYKGWLSWDEMNLAIAASDCTLVVPWSAERIGIPSKFYELCAYDKPIWIAGYDLGAFPILFAEWEHPAIDVGNAVTQTDAIIRAANGDYSALFRLSVCTGNLLREDGLCSAFEKLMH